MIRSPLQTRLFIGLAGLVLATVVVTRLPGRDDSKPAAGDKPLSAELTYIPADSAIFLHADVAKLWNGKLKAIRDADADFFADLGKKSSALFGATPDDLHSVSLFWPKFKSPLDGASFGTILNFKKPYDKAKLQAGFEALLPKGVKVALVQQTPTIAVLLTNLDAATYGKPNDKPGALSAAIREAGAGHCVVAGLNPAQLPDEIRREDIQELRAFRPLLDAESLTGIIDLDTKLTVDIRVKAASGPKAKEAEKSLGAASEMIQMFLGQGLKELGKDVAGSAEMKQVIDLLTRMQTGLKDAKFSTEGETARVVASMPADLKLGEAFVAARKKVQEAAARSQSSNNLKQIAIAMHSYHDTTNSLPPAAVCDKNGKPMLSWRVLILPYIEAGDLYKQFKLDEPWDSENNKKLIEKMPRVYAVPGSKAKPNETHYRVFVGNGAAFDYLKGAKLTDFQDGTSNTLLVVTAKDPVIWTKPDELEFDPDKDMTKLLGFVPSESVTMAAFGDGSVRALSKSIAKKTLNALITRSGGEVINNDDF
jgi:hypothetical protein